MQELTCADGENESTEDEEDESIDESMDDPVRFVYFYDHKKEPAKAECEADPQIGLDVS